MPVTRNPDATVRILDLSPQAQAEIAALIAGGGGGGGGGTVTQGPAGVVPWLVNDDYENPEFAHGALVASTDTPFPFAAPTVRAVRVVNWSTTETVLFKDSAIASDVDPAAARVGVAPAVDVPNVRWFPYRTAQIHLRSAGTPVCTVEAFR